MYTDYAEDTNSKNPFYIGTVVDNKDPTHNYRVKVRLPILHKKIPDNKLPWAARVDRAFRGMFSDTPKPEEPTQKDSTNSTDKNVQDKKDESKESKKKIPPKFDHCVPEVGTKVLVLAIQNDVNSLVYLGALYKKTDYTPADNGDNSKYLETYGIYSNEGQFIGIDCTGKEDNEIKVYFIGHVDVDKVKKITVNAEDDIKVTTKQNITIESTGSVDINIINKNGNVNVESKTLNAKVTESVKVECNTIDCDAKQSAKIKSPNITLDGNVNITGNVTISGNMSVEKNTSVQGNVSTQGNVSAQGEVTGNGVALSTHIHNGQGSLNIVEVGRVTGSTAEPTK